MPFSALLAPETLLSEWARLRLCCRDFSCSVLCSRSKAFCHSAHKLLSPCARSMRANSQKISRQCQIISEGVLLNSGTPSSLGLFQKE